MKPVNANSYHLGWILMVLLSFTACEVLSTEGNIGIGIVVAVVLVIGLGSLAFKFLGGILKIGIWGIVVLVLLIIGFIAWIIIQSMTGS